MTTTQDTPLAATVILPTHGERAAVLDYAIPSVLAQTRADIELFVIGDGVAPGTRAAIERFAAADPRVRFFDMPKHPRRGETYRHKLLQEARGRIVCYLCDRDLMLPDHVEHMGRMLERADFAHSARVAVNADDTLDVRVPLELSRRADRWKASHAIFAEAMRYEIPLPFVAHTLAAYRRLGLAWHTTPEGMFTDGFMWRKFLQHPYARCASDNSHVTILYFPRRPNADWPVERRAAELARWRAKMQQAGWRTAFEADLAAARAARAAIEDPPLPAWTQANLQRRYLTAVWRQRLAEAVGGGRP